MPLSTTDKLESILNHLNMVRSNCILLGKRLLAQGREKLARDMIVRGFQHDLSKISDDLEWRMLHSGKDISRKNLDRAIKRHRENNAHHVEHHNSVYEMSEGEIGELCCDVLSRCQEFGECVREWIDENIIEKNKISKDSQQYIWINNFLDILLENQFVK